MKLAVGFVTGLVGLVGFVVEEALDVYDRLTHKHEKWLAYQAEQRDRLWNSRPDL